MPETFYWTVQDGKLTRVHISGQVFDMPAPVDLNKHTTAEVEQFIRMGAEFGVLKRADARVSIIPPPDVPVVAPKSAAKKPAEGNTSRQYGKNPAKGRRYNAENGFEVPFHLRNLVPSRYVPRDMVDFAYTTAVSCGKQFTKRDVISAEGYSWGHHLLEYALVVWRARGIVTMPTKGVYALTWPTDAFKEFIKRRGSVTPEDVRNEFWVPLDVARERLEHAVSKEVVDKHASKEEYSFRSERIAAAKPQTAPTQIIRSSGASVVTPAPTYDPKDYKFVRGVRILCDGCSHHYSHAYWHISKNNKVCGGCYIKIGGSTSHGKEATIRKSRGR